MYLSSISSRLLLYDTISWDLKKSYGCYDGVMRDISWSDGSKYMLQVNSIGLIEILSPADHDVRSLQHIPIKETWSASFHREGHRNIAVGTKSGVVKIWDTKIKSVTETFPTPSQPSCVQFLSYNVNNTSLAATMMSGDTVIYDLESNIPVLTVKLTCSNSISAMKFHHESRSLLGLATDEGHVVLRDITTNKDTAFFENIHASPVSDISFSLINKDVMLSSGYDKIIQVYDIRLQNVVSTVKTSYIISSLAINAENQVALGTKNGHVLIYDLRDLTSPFKLLKGHEKEITKVAFQPTRRKTLSPDLSLREEVEINSPLKVQSPVKTPMSDMFFVNDTPPTHNLDVSAMSTDNKADSFLVALGLDKSNFDIDDEQNKSSECERKSDKHEIRDEAEEDYDPHLHRQVSKPTNNIETLVHLLKCSLGTGILAMPQAFARSGLVTGIIATVLVGILITHCLHVLVRSQYAACKQLRVPLLSYPDSVATALGCGPQFLRKFARPAALAVDIFLVVYQLGICCVYIVFIADNIKKVVDTYYVMPAEIHMLIILGPLIAFNLIPSLKLLAPFSALANLMTFVGLGIVVYYLVIGKKPSARDTPLDLWGSIETFPLFFGTVLFALTAVGVVIALENNMKTPKAFGKPLGVLNVGMTIIVLLYVGVGALGYVYCVSDCRDSITLDLPEKDPLATSVMVIFAIAIFISYGLHCYVPVEVLWKGYFLPRIESATPQKVRLCEYALRIGLCLLTFILAVAVPRLGLFISLFGALCLSALGICFPALMEICVSFPKRASAARSILFGKDIILFFIGVIGLLAGTYTALDSIIRSFAPTVNA